MKRALTTSIAVTTLGLALVALAGCGQSNPVSPTASLTPNASSAQVVIPIEDGSGTVTGGGSVGGSDLSTPEQPGVRHAYGKGGKKGNFKVNP